MRIVISLVSSLLTLIASLTFSYYLISRDSDNKKIRALPIDLVGISFSLIYLVSYISCFFCVNDLFDYIVYSFYLSFLFINAYIDFRTKFVYDIVPIFFGMIFLILIYFSKNYSVAIAIKSACFSGSIYFLIYFISKWIYKREVFGLGDVFLIFVGSLFLTPLMAVIASFLAFYIAVFFIILFKILGRNLDKLSEIPFGPYISLSLFICFVFNDKILKLFYLLMH